MRDYAVTSANVHDSKVAAHRKANQHGRMQGMWGQKKGCENAESCP